MAQPDFRSARARSNLQDTCYHDNTCTKPLKDKPKVKKAKKKKLIEQIGMGAGPH
jgi:hypothetical protein